MENMVNVFLFGKKYEIPAPKAIMEAMEYAGLSARARLHQLPQQRFCSACATIYRIAGDRELKACLACSTKVRKTTCMWRRCRSSRW